MVCLPRICEYTIKYMQVYLCVHMCGVCLSVCFVHVCACLDKCECVYVGALCACVMTLCPGLSAVLPPSPGALFLLLLSSSWPSPSLFSPWRAPPASRGLRDCFQAYDSWTSLSSQTSLWSPRSK